MSVERPYQVCLYVGPQAPTLDGVRVVNLTPTEHTSDGVIAALRSAELTPADLRSRVLFVADGGNEYRTATLMVYSALLGFAKRRIDVAFAIDGEAIPMDEFDARVRKMPVMERPETPADTAQVGGEARTDLTYLDANSAMSAGGAATIRFARRLRFVPPAATALALPQLVAIAALRARGQMDKLPLLCDGTEPAPEGVTDAAGVCLDTLRRAGEEIRRGLRSDTRDALAPRLEENPNFRLAEADAIPVERTLVRLGARSKIIEMAAKPGTPEHAQGTTIPTEVWHCPRPDRHTHGDANPSSRIVTKGETTLFQCFRCDPERVGSLRLVMDTLGKTGAEAANWLLNH